MRQMKPRLEPMQSRIEAVIRKENQMRPRGSVSFGMSTLSDYFLYDGIYFFLCGNLI